MTSGPPPAERGWRSWAPIFGRPGRRATGLFRPPPLLDASGRPNRSAQWKLALAVLVLAVLAGVLHHTRLPKPPPIALDCHHPAIKLSSSTARTRQILAWSGTGPASDQVELAIGRTLHPAGADVLTAEPAPGQPSDTAEALGALQGLNGCSVQGTFVLTVPAGSYTVTLFQVTGSGAAATGRPIATAPLTVSS
ncbi:MAG TPA: hypothetical protein VNG13_05005 [Mycobacteriales bacterium]|nr:hypothetical protein [Mycobacteriales bacterium]